MLVGPRGPEAPGQPTWSRGMWFPGRVKFKMTHLSAVDPGADLGMRSSLF